jgi:two-component system chemotaxis response regulator CheY
MEEGPIILVVDDDAGTREAVRFLLEDDGYVVEVAANGQIALDRLGSSARAPALVLLDLMMPGMDGETLLRELEGRNDLPRVPIVVMTAAGPSVTTSGLQYPLLRKPFGLDDLMKIVTTYCPHLWEEDEPLTDETSVVRDRAALGIVDIGMAEETPVDRCSKCAKRAATRCAGCGEAFCKKCLDAGPDGRCARCFRSVQS